MNLSQDTAIMYAGVKQRQFMGSRQGYLEPMTLRVPKHWHFHSMQTRVA